MSIVWSEGTPFILGSFAVFAALAFAFRFILRKRKAAAFFLILAFAGAGYMLYFFRDPVRRPPPESDVVLAGADGVVMAVEPAPANAELGGDAVRISIFLSLFDVHVNRFPIGGTVISASYHPGSRYFTFQEKSSQYNQHSSILIRGEKTDCLVKQIVGPVARRVVYWTRVNDRVEAGAKLGMMKFGSRLDIYLPGSKVEITTAKGDKVRAGETIVARIIGAADSSVGEAK